ncbi:MAG: response regulator [Acidimicrobiales bacterium]
MIRVFVIDDDHFFRAGLVGELEAMAGLEVVGSAGTLSEGLAHEEPFDVLLLDLGLPGSCRRTATADALERWPQTHVLVITGYASGPDVVQAFAEGARGYVTKSIRPRDLRDAIETVSAGRSYCTPTLAGHLLNAGLRVSPAERAVLRYVAEGLADKQVAASLGISEKAVENRLASVRLKAGLLDRSRSSITRFAMEADAFCQMGPEEHLDDDKRRRRVHRLVTGRTPRRDAEPSDGFGSSTENGLSRSQ